ncbi:Phospholipid-transporting ATPase 1 [Hordeum vulgare]|nr:Phospholipid-transporting ATPase 1 [Hordeum vulgare]
MENIIFEVGVVAAGGPNAAGYDLGEIQSQDTYEHDAFMHDQVDLELDGFPLDHESPEDYDLKEEDELDIHGEPLFEEELANQAAGSKPKHKSNARRHTRRRTTSSFAFQALKAFKVQHEGKSFNLSHCWRVINEEEKFKAQYATLMANGGKKGEEEVVDGEKTRPRGKTNSKKEEKRDAASNALISIVENMITKKGSREEKHLKDKEDHVNAFMDIQRRRLEMEAEKQAKMFEMEAEKQARMLDIEAGNAKTKAKEDALTSMKTGVEIMKVDLNTISPRKRPTCSSSMRTDQWSYGPSFFEQFSIALSMFLLKFEVPHPCFEVASIWSSDEGQTYGNTKRIQEE